MAARRLAGISGRAPGAYGGAEGAAADAAADNAARAEEDAFTRRCRLFVCEDLAEAARALLPR